MDGVGALLDQVAETLPTTRAELRKLKTRVAAQLKQPLIRNDALLVRYRQDVAEGRRQPQEALQRILRLNGIRSHAGIATVTVITEPYACPGRCVYCPTEARAPKSYLTNEPAVMRALRNDYDPFRQVAARLQALEETGHPTDKIELIVKGGTWSFYPDDYQRWFIQQCFVAATTFFHAECGVRSAAYTTPHTASRTPNLEEAQHANETATRRIIGVTIETRPDDITPEELRRLRELGVTRVELGVQILNERILELIVRDHGTAEIRRATALLREAGFKIAYHLMPNLPGATPEDDLESFRLLFDDPAYRPDTLKIYPCVVIESAELFDWWRQGRYEPYDDETLVELLIQLKTLVPPYVRIERVIRDIPSTSIQAGCKVTNLREEVQRRMRARGLRCQCLRCRQVREEAGLPAAPDGSLPATKSPGQAGAQAGGTYQLVRREYEAAGGTEIFLSMEDPATDRLAAFLRLRIPAPTTVGAPLGWTALEGAALIRELHTYGLHLPLHERTDDAAQHRGFGRTLMAEAERIAAQEHGLTRVAVIAGVGVRDYYRRLGYDLRETYMVKSLAPSASSLEPRAAVS